MSTPGLGFYVDPGTVHDLVVKVGTNYLCGETIAWCVHSTISCNDLILSNTIIVYLLLLISTSSQQVYIDIVASDVCVCMCVYS